jgi:AAA15 family ATPase/GTPase
MTKYLNRITGLIPNTRKEININLNGKNLIITGANGCGKTSFLRATFKKIDLLIAKKRHADLGNLQAQLNFYQKTLSQHVQGTSSHADRAQQIKYKTNEIDAITNGLQLDILDHLDFSIKVDKKVAMIKFFEATRIAKITHSDGARGIKKIKDENIENNNQNPGINLEQHLVNLRNRKSLAFTEDNDAVLANKIGLWFNNFENSLKKLMEDSSTKLLFDSDTLKFSISQDGKPSYNFQTLSSGYLAIFDIYADLLMRVEYFSTTPEELCGVVFIDEIDAHLHVSLQRLILPFLEEAFPQIQFIVTTHSPFVLMSVNDAVIFDISRNEQVEEDLSLYSYSAVIEGLLGTKPSSELLDNIINEIAAIAAAKNKDYNRLQELIGKIQNNGAHLDSHYKAFYRLGVSALLDKDDK